MVVQGTGRSTQHLRCNLKGKEMALWDCLTKPDCSSLSYKGIAIWNNPNTTFICHKFKSDTVVLDFHCNLFWLPALFICSYQTNTHSTGVHNSLSHQTLHHRTLSNVPAMAGKKEGLLSKKRTQMFLTSKHHQSCLSAISILRSFTRKSWREQVPKRK